MFVTLERTYDLDVTSEVKYVTIKVAGIGDRRLLQEPAGSIFSEEVMTPLPRR
jgi:hypothetical protein